jgi:hypothetical protein
LSSSPKAGVDFFAHGGLPVPRVTIQDAERMAGSSFGLTVRAQPLGSQQDSNFLLTEPAGGVAGVLKIANPAFSAAEIEAQDGAAAAAWRRVEPGQRGHLAAEPGAELRVVGQLRAQHLHRDRLAVPGLGQVDDAHPARAEPGDQAVPPDPGRVRRLQRRTRHLGPLSRTPAW